LDKFGRLQQVRSPRQGSADFLAKHTCRRGMLRADGRAVKPQLWLVQYIFENRLHLMFIAQNRMRRPQTAGPQACAECCACFIHPSAGPARQSTTWIANNNPSGIMLCADRVHTNRLTMNENSHLEANKIELHSTFANKTGQW